ncbi:MAG TPA: alanine--tRNA ligase [Ktedonobacterales bacterium]|nr:alanine--tRNA ligase [Ktedonobacterales bacterium]
MAVKKSTGGKPAHGGNANRETFLRYFEERGHHRLPSSSLIPRSDPTVLLTTAGMQQMIPYFLGQEQPPARLLTSTQKCFRTTDIDSVGDASHLTFFEMLGNFSVGEYFKRDAIAYAWDLLTNVYGIPKDRLHPTVHPDDDEAPGLWHEVAGIPDAAITRLADNWWGPPGKTGPCGPDSEIYYDRGAALSCGNADCAPGCDRCERYLEVWNLVFMQFYQDGDGNRTPLKQRNIDTGMGLERLSMVLQGKDSVFDTDLFRPIIDKFAALIGTEYGHDHAADRHLRVIADHGRALVFLAADNVLPSNEGRGYIFRRVLRRAVLHGKQLGLDGPFLAEAADTVINLMSGHYRELAARRDQIVDVLSMEERKFGKTLSAGMSLLGDLLATLAQRGERVIPGDAAFRLYDTHGFPLELTREIADERGITVDEVGYQAALLEQQKRSKVEDAFARKGEEETWTALVKTLDPTTFTGYAGVEGSSEVLAIVVDGQLEDAVSAPQRAAVVLRATPFYAEAGGQIGDRGVIGGETGTLRVDDTQRPVPGLTVHYGAMTEGHLRVGSPVRAEVDLARRQETMRNHSGTHLLHRALKEVLGEQVHQQGSLVEPERLRFDFNFPRALTAEELRAIEAKTNAWILADHPVTTQVMPYKEAVATGAMALFSEKYGDQVRVVTMGPSKELCGGTHCAATGQIGLLVITQETSIAAGVRRIEALTGLGALDHLRARSALVDTLAERLQARPDTLVDRVRALQEELGEARKRLSQAQRGQAREEAERLAATPEQVAGIPVVAATVSVPDDRALRDLSDAIRSRLGSGVVLLAAAVDGQARFIVTADEALTRRGVHAGKIAQAVGARLGGKGGGRPDSAQGGGRDVRQLAAAVSSVNEVVAAQVG